MTETKNEQHILSMDDLCIYLRHTPLMGSIAVPQGKLFCVP